MDIFRWKYNTNKLHLLFMFSYSLSNVFNVKNTPSGREEMLFEDKSLLRKKNTRENITEQIESMNISGWKYYTNMLNLLFMIKVPKTVCSLTASPTFLKTKILFQVEWQCCWKTNTCWEKKLRANIIETNWIHEFASILKRLVSFTTFVVLLNTKRHLQVERQWR